MRSAAPVTQNHLSKPEDLMLQKYNPSQEISALTSEHVCGHVSCTAPTLCNASLQILFKRPTSAMIFEIARKPSGFAHFWRGREPITLATEKDS